MMMCSTMNVLREKMFCMIVNIIAEKKMIKIKLNASNEFGKAGEIIEVTGNIGHGIIDKGEGTLYFQGQAVDTNQSPYKNRMINNKGKRYVIKS